VGGVIEIIFSKKRQNNNNNNEDLGALMVFIHGIVGKSLIREIFWR
jgi:hypothetical protein